MTSFRVYVRIPDDVGRITELQMLPGDAALTPRLDEHGDVSDLWTAAELEVALNERIDKSLDYRVETVR